MAALMTVSPGRVSVKLNEKANVDATIKDLKTKLSKTAGNAIVNIVQKEDGDEGGTNNIEVMVTGDNIDNIKEGAILLTKELASVKGIENISNNLAVSKPEIAIKVDQQKASKYGLSAGTMISHSLAVIVIGGLTTSTLLTLIVVPVAYELFEGIKIKLFC